MYVPISDSEAVKHETSPVTSDELAKRNAKDGCVRAFGPDYCLVRFEKKSENNYWATCGLVKEGHCL